MKKAQYKKLKVGDPIRVSRKHLQWMGRNSWDLHQIGGAIIRSTDAMSFHNYLSLSEDMPYTANVKALSKDVGEGPGAKVGMELWNGQHVSFWLEYKKLRNV